MMTSPVLEFRDYALAVAGAGVALFIIASFAALYVTGILVGWRRRVRPEKDQ